MFSSKDYLLTKEKQEKENLRFYMFNKTTKKLPTEYLMNKNLIDVWH